MKKATFNKECVLNDYQFSSNGDQIYLKPDIKRLKQDNMCDENTMPSIEIEIKPELNDFIVKNEYDKDNGYFMNVTRIKIEQDIQNTLEKEEFSNNKIISNEKVHIVKQNAIFFREQNNMHDNNVISSNEIKTEIKPECNNMNDDEYIADDDYFSSEEIKIDVEKDKHFSGEHNKMHDDNMISSEKIEIEIKPKLNDFIVNDDVFNQTSEKSTKKCEYLSLIKEKKFGQSSCMMECIYVTPEASVQKLLIPEDTIPNINSGIL